jgi:hypothetical protein
MVLDFRNLTRGEQIAGVAGVALFVIMLALRERSGLVLAGGAVSRFKRRGVVCVSAMPFIQHALAD